MAASRLELHLVRLLCRCGAVAAAKWGPEEWPWEKYVGALEDIRQAPKAPGNKPASQVFREHSRKVDFLMGMLLPEKLASSSDKALASQFLSLCQGGGAGNQDSAPAVLGTVHQRCAERAAKHHGLC